MIELSEANFIELEEETMRARLRVLLDDPDLIKFRTLKGLMFQCFPEDDKFGIEDAMIACIVAMTGDEILAHFRKQRHGELFSEDNAPLTKIQKKTLRRVYEVISNLFGADSDDTRHQGISELRKMLGVEMDKAA